MENISDVKAYLAQINIIAELCRIMPTDENLNEILKRTKLIKEILDND